MKKNTIIKVLLDVVMLVLYLILTFGRFADGLFHEAAGIGIGILFIIHVALNKAMTKALYKSVKNRKAKPDRILLFVSDIILTLFMPVVIITGILIGKEIFLISFNLPWGVISSLHNLSSYICLGVMLLHLLLHGKYLKGAFKKLPAAFRTKEMGKALLTFSTGVLVAILIYTCLSLYTGNKNDGCNGCESCQNTTCAMVSTTVPSASTTAEATQSFTEAASTQAPSSGQTIDAPEESTTATSEETTVSKPTLEEYLASIICDGCNKGCTLLNPRCSTGRANAEKAKEEYYHLYPDT